VSVEPEFRASGGLPLLTEEWAEEWAVINQQSHFWSGWRVYTLNMSTTFFVLLMTQSPSKLMVCRSVGLL